MKFDISDYADPVVNPHKNTHEFTNKLKNCPVGKAVIVRGMEAQNLNSRVSRIKKETGFVFAVNRLEDGAFQITRIS